MWQPENVTCGRLYVSEDDVIVQVQVQVMTSAVDDTSAGHVGRTGDTWQVVQVMMSVVRMMMTRGRPYR
jgi:hypothetical protein